MGFTGKFIGIGRDLITHKYNVSISVNEDATTVFKDLYGKEIDIIFRRHRDKRSLDANAYYWVLLTKLARVHGWSNDEAHNRMLRRYGQLERLDGQLIAIPLPDTEKTEDDVLCKVEYHLMPTSKVTMMKGELYRVYIMLRGSSTYNTEEMARLISGLIQDCRDSDIPESEIMTPFEKKKLKEQYGIDTDGGHNEQENQGAAI